MRTPRRLIVFPAVEIGDQCMKTIDGHLGALRAAGFDGTDIDPP
jgi:hypothetical protein